MHFGPSFPFYAEGQGAMPRQEDMRLLKNDLKQLLLTKIRERPLSRGLGIDWDAYLFKNITDYTSESIKNDIIRCIDVFEPRVSRVDEVVIKIDKPGHLIYIKVFCVDFGGRTFDISLSVNIDE